jgi:hypothetical protein
MAKYVQVRVASDGELWRYNGGAYYVCKGQEVCHLSMGGSTETLREVLDGTRTIEPKWLRAYIPELAVSASGLIANDLQEGGNWKFIADNWVDYLSNQFRKILDGYLDDMNGASAALDEFVRVNK